MGEMSRVRENYRWGNEEGTGPSNVKAEGVHKNYMPSNGGMIAIE